MAARKQAHPKGDVRDVAIQRVGDPPRVHFHEYLPDGDLAPLVVECFADDPQLVADIRKAVADYVARGRE